jgi:hypothetical protein
MAIDGALDGLFIGGDSEVVYTDSDPVPPDMAAWNIVLDIRKKDTSNSPALLSKIGVVSGVYANTQAANQQKVTFTLTAAEIGSTIFKGDDPRMRYSIKRTNAGAEQPLRYGDCTIIRVTQIEGE